MNPVRSSKLQIVVLAAGFSSRLGQAKPLARVHGVSLLRRTLTVASGLATHRIIVVVPRNAARYRIEARGFRVSWAENAVRVRGLSSSVQRGITAARRSSGVLLLPADLVHLNRRDLCRLVRRWHGAPRRVAARKIDLAGAIPLILPRWLFARTAALSGNVGLREMIRKLPGECRVLVAMPSADRDVDAPQDLNAARRRFRSSTA
jgi:molybdenum cofactor cytidylyltransferase